MSSLRSIQFLQLPLLIFLFMSCKNEDPEIKKHNLEQYHKLQVVMGKERSLDGFGGLKWGVSKDTVKKYMNRLKDTKLRKDLENQRLKVLIYADGSFSGYPVQDWNFKFFDDRLFNVTIIIDGSYNGIVKDLTDKYGEASYSSQGVPDMENSDWNFNKEGSNPGIIELTKYNDQQRYGTGAILEYKSIDISDQYSEWTKANTKRRPNEF